MRYGCAVLNTTRSDLVAGTFGFKHARTTGLTPAGPGVLHPTCRLATTSQKFEKHFFQKQTKSHAATPSPAGERGADSLRYSTGLWNDDGLHYYSDSSRFKVSQADG